MKTIKLIGFLSILTMLTVVFSCQSADDGPDFECGFAISTEELIVPMVETHCAVALCHLDATSPILNSKEAILANAEAIVAQIETFQMPPASSEPLEELEIELFKVRHCN